MVPPENTIAENAQTGSPAFRAPTEGATTRAVPGGLAIPPRRPYYTDMTPYLLVGIGGALGAMLRYGAQVAVGNLLNGFPTSTLLINILGSAAMGVLIGVLARTTPQYQNEIRLFVAVGIFGGFTTFSSFSLDAITLIERGDIMLAAIYIVGSVLLSLAGLWVGMLAMRVIA